MKVIQRNTCTGCKALIEDTNPLSLMLDFNIALYTCQLGYKIDRNLAIPKEPCPKPISDKALSGCKHRRVG